LILIDIDPIKIQRALKLNTQIVKEIKMKGTRVFVLTVAVALLAGAAWSAELVGYWLFSENQGTVAKNSVVSGYDGDIHGAKWVPGK